MSTAVHRAENVGTVDGLNSADARYECTLYMPVFPSCSRASPATSTRVYRRCR